PSPFSLPMTPRPPCSPPLPYTTLFRSRLALSREEVDLAAVVSEVAEGFRAQAESVRSELRIRLNAKPHGTWDRLRLEQVLHNLRSEEHTSELQSLRHIVCRLLLEKKKE